jgi:hypothetical protein
LRVVALLAFLYGFIFPDLICDRAGSCSRSTAYQSAFASASNRAEHSSTSGCSSHNLCSGMFLMIFLCLFALCAIMRGFAALTVLLVLPVLLVLRG